MKKPIVLLLAIIFLAVVSGIFIYPQGIGKSIRPWRLGLDLVGGVELTYETDLSRVADADKDSVMNGLKDVIERRVNLFGVSEPQVITVKAGNSRRLVVELAGIKDVNQAIKEIGQTPFLDFREVVEGTSTASTSAATGSDLRFIPTGLDGRFVKGAQVGIDSVTGSPLVNIEFTGDGAKIFEDLTARNIGKPLAIFLDNQLIEMPNVREKITGGKAQISGKFTADSARELVARFNAGALPAPINLISQSTIGASLGTEFLIKAIRAGIIGTILVILFMAAFYRGFGIFASIALIIYILLSLGIFKGLSVTMSLAGIAGFILSIGMAVDGNILIFERTKEEIKKGISRVSAIEEGFKRAWPSIRDSHITTLISAVILYYFTTSFVKGFALTLAIGVLLSMFSAVIVTRSLMKVFIRK